MGEPSDEDDAPSGWDRLRSTGERISEVTSQIASRASDAGRGAVGWTYDLSSSLREWIAESAGALTDAIWESTSVPVFLLPRGSRKHDFEVFLNLEPVIDKLRAGKLARPQLEVWAGRDDFDPRVLGLRLREAFRAEIERIRSSSDSPDGASAEKLERLEDKAEETASRSGSAAYGTAAAFIAMLMIANPLLDLLLLGLAILTGADFVVSGLRSKLARADVEAAKRELAKEAEEFEEALERGDEKLTQAVQDLSVEIHPLLMALVADFCDVDGRSPPAIPEAHPNAPPVRHLVESAQYRERLQDWYQPLVDSRLEEFGAGA